jgi:hypothetical protein
VALPKGFVVLDALLADVDGAGGDDLVIARAALTDEGKGMRRSLTVHLDRDGRLSAEPVRTLDLPADVVAYLVADVHDDPGAEIVLLNARGAFAWRTRADAKPPIVRLFETDFLWQVPDDGEVFAWQSAARDLDGDGLVDLCLPEPFGFRVGLQRRDESGASEGKSGFPDVRRLEVPAPGTDSVLVERGAGGRSGQARARRRGREVSVGFDEEGLSFEENQGPLLSIFEVTPAPQLVDWDADSDLDLVAHTAEDVLVWENLGGGPGGFEAEPTLRLKAPVVRDEGRMLDVSFSAHTVELDGDGRIDCVIFAGDKRSKDVRTQGLVFLRGPEPEEAPLFGAEGVPSQVLVLAGFVASPRFPDVDGDGLDDLVVTVLRPDLIDAVRAASTERIDAQLYVYLNQGGRFSRKPDLEHSLSFSADSSEYAVRFVSDVDGNGLLDLFVRDDVGDGRGRLSVRRTRRERERLTIVEKPLWELTVGEDARLVFPERDAVNKGILVIEEEQVLCVSLP